jgi:hypothetical protein
MTEPITRLLHAVDARDWDTARTLFPDEVRTDYTSLWGGEPATVPADELIAGWRDLLGVLDATQHLTGPVIEVDGRLHTHVRAHHWRAGSAWTVFGHYIALVEDGRIAELTLQTFHEEGSRDILKPAG